MPSRASATTSAGSLMNFFMALPFGRPGRGAALKPSVASESVGHHPFVGEGGDSLRFASRGWQMTGVDISQTALARASAAARNAGLVIDFQRHDLAVTFPEGSYDLVSAQFLQSPIEFPRAAVLQSAAGAV